MAKRTRKKLEKAPAPKPDLPKCQWCKSDAHGVVTAFEYSGRILNRYTLCPSCATKRRTLYVAVERPPNRAQRRTNDRAAWRKRRHELRWGTKEQPIPFYPRKRVA